MAVDLARWQFGVTTVYHFLFVPLTIGLGFLIAVIESIYVAKNDEKYKKMAQFWMKFFLINLAIGVVTGIMQEFQFGMNWSTYSRFVGDVFGAPLAVEALAAFFLESTFLGVWLFGWDRLSKKVHLAAIWLVAFGSTISAFWILTANAFMQEPTGYAIHNGHAEMISFGALLTNPQLWVEFPHVFFGAIATGSFFVVGISAWYLLRKRAIDLFRPSFRIATVFALVSSILTVVVGHEQAQHEVVAQPMKMAAAEALWNTSPLHAPETLIAGIDAAGHHNTFAIKVPYLLSILSYNRLSGKVEGINPLQHQYVQQYGPGNYIPNVDISFWTFRLMVGAGSLMILLSLIGLVLFWRKRELKYGWFLKAMVASISLPYIANTAGWVFTEMGRQPWVVYGLLKTSSAVSPTVSNANVLFTLIGFAFVYAVLLVIAIFLAYRTLRRGPEDAPEQEDSSTPNLLFEPTRGSAS
ncbi:cytochrome ubiquinol oxidase subunit I [Alicyclobacillus acidoterrestris]|uniref:Cytochrome ubiquinol oxidase subunit I n=1 Tax=Alicyclobacillus acidoterrestris (strain ATCC 49025 / DSM 3922 / CIP 106132 / NCIMB 13137 / GD3B) TaxID=1356854 RepID=T0DTY6_ALIAG|nr:cytochrome ubiquinol oxidase subunit I [Alicyclobacillus acidoterrestris]EPZ52926.1 hypothetical protein N007_02150 [Alicyclobacillus acidoterrestris ATCC 49025]UNO49136.1 cytochrome ubiquinol oxidase subunit I [Alicyclobacillus acidoterrestris]